MISKLVRLPMVLAIGPYLNTLDAARDIPGKCFVVPSDDETGWERVKKMFMTE